MMDRDRALQIQKHLLDADSAMERARRVIAGLPKAERVKFNELAVEVLAALHLDLLAALYDEHPDLKPPEVDDEDPEVDSTLRWNEVRLPPHISEADIDAVIFSVMKPQWRKVAMVVGHTHERCKDLGIAISNEAVAARLQALAEAGHIEDVGDLRMWGYSEVRLKD
jgi:Protein of unknown function